MYHWGFSTVSLGVSLKCFIGSLGDLSDRLRLLFEAKPFMELRSTKERFSAVLSWFLFYPDIGAS